LQARKVQSPELPTTVIIFGYLPRDPHLEFRLAFADGYEKYYKLDAYEVRQFRATEREIIEHFAREYYEINGYPTDNIKLILLDELAYFLLDATP
jgi:hypothetical protein